MKNARLGFAWVLVVLLMAISVSTADVSAAEARRPNIILILADDYGIPGVGCYGGIYKTPHLDALAADGLRFTHAYSMPLCAPTRGVVLSGRYPFRNGVRDNGGGGNYKPTDSPSIAAMLKSAGYATAVAGKWRQLSYLKTPDDARAWGFDEFMIWDVSVNPKGERYWDPAYNHNGKPVDAGDKYGPDLLHDFVVDFIERHRDEPFFVYYPTPLVHSPLLHTPDSGKQGGNRYADNVAYLDKLVGKLATELDRLKLRENTMLVFVGDNGSTGDANNKIDGKVIDGAKGSMLEGGSRVPLIVHWKGTTPQGKVIDDPVDVSDFYATFAEAAGAKLPADVKFDGHSFAPQLRGETGTPRSTAFVQLGDQWFVRSKSWKLDQAGTLYSMKNAPYEQIAVAADSQDPAAAAARQELQAALDEVGPSAAKSKAGDAKPKKKGRRAAKPAP